MDLDQLLCAKEVGALLGVNDRTAARLMRTGEIRAFKFSGSIWRTPRRQVLAYIAREMELGALQAS
jgi:excisionase family DNA binding protein